MKVIAIGGEPGSGKTTLMKEIIRRGNYEPKYNNFKMVPYLQDTSNIILGKYEDGEVYGGTDKMSMAVNPEAINFLETLPEETIVLFEGDRLFTSSFLEHCVENYNTKLVYLKTQKSIREERYEKRGSNQNKKWLQGRETKISNILTNFNLMFNTITFNNNDTNDLHNNVEKIMEMVSE